MISLTYRISKSQSRQRQAIGRPDKYQIWLIGKLKGIIFRETSKIQDVVVNWDLSGQGISVLAIIVSY